MKVTVVGCGALGGLCAARLARAGNDVQVLQHEGCHMDQLRSRGLVLCEREGVPQLFRPRLSSRPEDLEPSDVVLVTVKAYATASVAPGLPGLLSECGRVVTLQNGLGNAELLAEAAGAGRVVLGPCTYGAWLDDEGTVHAAGEGELVLGSFSREGDLASLATLFREAEFNVSLRDDVFPALWEKLVINAGINPLTALVRCRNGDLVTTADLREIMRSLVREAVSVAQSQGISLDGACSWESCLAVCKRTASNRSSMLQDVEAGRCSENEAISGQVVRRARDKGLSVPVTETVWRLLRGVDLFSGGTLTSS